MTFDDVRVSREDVIGPVDKAGPVLGKFTAKAARYAETVGGMGRVMDTSGAIGFTEDHILQQYAKKVECLNLALEILISTLSV